MRFIFKDNFKFLQITTFLVVTLFAVIPQAHGVSGLTTTYAGGNGSGGNMFDLTAINTVTISGFDISASTYGAVNIEVYYKSGTYVGNETNSGAWTLLGSTTVTGAGSGNPVFVNIGGVTVPAGETYGIYLSYNNTVYTTGANTYSNSDISLTLGAGKASLFGTTYSPRTWNGTVYYTTNEAPVANNDLIVVDEDADISGTLSATDGDGDGLTYSIVSDSTLGTAVITNSSTGAFIYTPYANKEGADSFTFKVNDSTVDSNIATISLTINGINDDSPVATASNIITIQNLAATTQVTHNDPDVADSHTFTVTTNGVNGVASVNSSGLATYTPNENFFGADTFTVFVEDSFGLSSDVTITVTVEEVDGTAPTDGTLTTTVGNSNVSLSWTDAVDAVTGVASYDVVVSTTGSPLVNCTDGDVIYSGTGNSFNHTTAKNGTTYYYRLCATDGASNVSDGITGSETPFTTEGLTIPSFDTGIEGIERVDGGDDSNNFDTATSNPVVDLKYEFSIVLKDTVVGTTPSTVKVYISSRLSPGVSDVYGIELSCVGELADGVLCSGTTLLGPAADYSFYFTAVLGDGLTAVRYPSAGGTYITGPSVELLNGYTLVGVPRDISTASLDGTGAFTTSYSYRWLSTGMSNDSENNGAFEELDDSGVWVSAGEGYFVYKDTGITTLESFDAYAENASPSFTTRALRPGWNIMSNPFGGNVNLSDITVVNSDGWSGSWEEAAEEEIVVNGIYYYNGSDWGSTYAFESAGTEPEAVLTPWLSYWVYLNDYSSIYKFVIPKP